MKNHHEVGHFKNRLMIVLLSLFVFVVTAGQSFAATTCSSCHGMPPLDSSDGSRQPVTGAFKGNHQTHVSPVGAAAECVKCHNSVGYNSTHAATSNYTISIASNIFSSPSSAKYSRGTSFPQSATPPSTLGTCRNVSCHFEAVTPAWDKAPVASAATNCNTCHTTPRGASGSHAKHEAFYGGINSCSKCHPSYGFGSYSTSASKSKFSHATSAGKHKIAVNTFLTYSGGTATSWLPSQTKVFGSCRATACHDTGRDNPRTLVWNTSAAACTACHALQPATFSHTKHLTGLAATYNRNAVCADCHGSNYVQGVSADPTHHLDGNVDVYYASPGDLGYSVSKAKGTALASCSTSNCHSNGSISSRIYAPATWGGISTGCNFCHPNLSAAHAAHTGSLLASINFYNFTSNKSSSSAYQFGCGSCHPNSSTNHLNGSIDVDLTPAAAGGILKLKNLAGATINASKKCNNIYCHSNGYSAAFKCVTTLAWTDKFINYTAASKGSKDKCAWCHGNSPNNGTRVGSNAHSAHVVGIHYDDIFNGVSKKLPISGGSTVNAAHGRDNRSTTINCNVCHAATVTSSANDKNTQCVGCHNGSTAPVKNPAELISDKSKHVNGVVDVAFMNQKIATKAQLAGSAFAGYTADSAGGWTRNKNIYKTYTSGYDVTKLTMVAAGAAYSSAGVGCSNIACHSSIPVKWTDTVTCTSCHTRLK